jgi:hypothetical protein
VGVLYLAALIAALGILAIQLFSHGDAGGDVDGDVAGHLGADGGDHATLSSHPGAADHGGLAILVSLRFWTFALLAFGLVGVLLWFLRLSGPIATFVLATSMGLGSGALASLTFRILARGQISSGGELDDVVGKLGRILVTPQGASYGKVRIEVRGQIHDYLAKTVDVELAPGTFVVIDDVREGVAHVSRAPDDLLPMSSKNRS